MPAPSLKRRTLGFLARQRRLIGQRLTAPLTPWTIFGFFVTISALVVVGLAPAFRGDTLKWNDPKSWKAAIGITWPGIVAAVYLKYSEKVKRKTGSSKTVRRNRIGRKLASLSGITEIHKLVDAKNFDPERLRPGREAILTAIGLSVEELLKLTDSDRLAVSLLDFSTGAITSMRVVARSNKDRPVWNVYPVSRLVAWEAIRTGAVSVQDDVRNDRRWDAIGERRYRSVVAVPIMRDTKAFGAVSLDSEQPFAFFGRGKEIAVQIAPYLGVLALTYEPNGVSCDCKYDPTHL